jgi:catechol 2,3-dioxygenase-like lactoylglutathione lyase family enzyme
VNIDHINICAPQDLLEQVRDFYCAVLLLEEGPRPDFGIPGYWLYGHGKPILHLMESPGHGGADGPYYLDHVAFSVSGIHDYTQRLDELGVPYSVNHIPDFNTSQVFCHDPCGIGVEANFSNETPPAKA